MPSVIRHFFFMVSKEVERFQFFSGDFIKNEDDSISTRAQCTCHAMNKKYLVTAIPFECALSDK